MRRDRDSLYDILDASRLVLEYTCDLDFNSFVGSRMIQDAVIRRFEVIGEATKRLSREFRKKHPDLPWDDMAGMRDRVIHGYDTVDARIVWNAVRESVPRLIATLEVMVAEFDSD